MHRRRILFLVAAVVFVGVSADLEFWLRRPIAEGPVNARKGSARSPPNSLSDPAVGISKCRTTGESQSKPVHVLDIPDDYRFPRRTEYGAPQERDATALYDHLPSVGRDYFGNRTASMTWITPLEHSISVAVTFASSTFTFPPSTAIANSPP